MLEEIILVVLIILLAALLVYNAISSPGGKPNRSKNSRRTDIPCSFKDGISAKEFESIVRKAAAGFQQIQNLRVDGTYVKGSVVGDGANDNCSFTIDFNDYGHVTGKYYWLRDGQPASDVPVRLAQQISQLIGSYAANKARLAPGSTGSTVYRRQDNDHYGRFCPRCGRQNQYHNVKSCQYCGEDLK